MLATPGERETLAAILIENLGAEPMPGCLSYVVASDPANDDALWITEVWVDAERHQVSLELPAVREAIGKARRSLPGAASAGETMPLGGMGLVD